MESIRHKRDPWGPWGPRGPVYVLYFPPHLEGQILTKKIRFFQSFLFFHFFRICFARFCEVFEVLESLAGVKNYATPLCFASRSFFSPAAFVVVRRRPHAWPPEEAAVEVAQRLGLAESEAAAQAEKTMERPYVLQAARKPRLGLGLA